MSSSQRVEAVHSPHLIVRLLSTSWAHCGATCSGPSTWALRVLQRQGMRGEFSPHLTVRVQLIVTAQYGLAGLCGDPSTGPLSKTFHICQRQAV
jgi:hypothetical protein